MHNNNYAHKQTVENRFGRENKCLKHSGSEGMQQPFFKGREPVESANVPVARRQPAALSLCRPHPACGGR